jgi:hypothetical protein
MAMNKPTRRTLSEAKLAQAAPRQEYAGISHRFITMLKAATPSCTVAVRFWNPEVVNEFAKK